MEEKSGEGQGEGGENLSRPYDQALPLDFASTRTGNDKRSIGIAKEFGRALADKCQYRYSEDRPDIGKKAGDLCEGKVSTGKACVWHASAYGEQRKRNRIKAKAKAKSATTKGEK